jgi:hypothetical protein
MLSVTLRFAPNQKPAQNLTMSGRTQKKPAKSGRAGFGIASREDAWAIKQLIIGLSPEFQCASLCTVRYLI